MDKSTEMQKQVLIDGIDELEATPQLQNKIKHLKTKDTDYQRTYGKDSLGNGFVDINRYQNGQLDEAYQREFSFIRNPDEKSDFFNINKLVEVNVKEPSRNIDQNINVAELNSEQVDILNGVLMVEEQTDRDVLISQYKGLSDSQAMQKLVKENDRTVPNDNGINNAGSVNFHGSTGANRNLSMNNETRSDHNEAVETTHEEEDMEHINSSVRKNTRITQQSEEEHDDERSKLVAERRNKVIAGSLIKQNEALIRSYGVKERELYVNKKLNLNIEGTLKDMKPLNDRLGDIQSNNLRYDDYNRQLKEVLNGDNSVLKAEKLTKNDLDVLNEYRQMEETPSQSFYGKHVQGAFDKLMEDYQNEQPARALLVDLNSATDTLDKRFGAAYNAQSTNNIDKKILENSIVQAARNTGNFINERGDKYVTNLKNANVDKIISLGSEKELSMPKKMSKTNQFSMNDLGNKINDAIELDISKRK